LTEPAAEDRLCTHVQVESRPAEGRPKVRLNFRTGVDRTVLVRSRLVSIVIVVVATAACWVGVTDAGSTQPQPQAGTWKFGEATGGFSLVKGKGKLLLTNVHSFTQNFVGCPDKSERITVQGRFPLKLLPLAGFPGYKAWGVGRPASSPVTATATQDSSRSPPR
jgi:hypothetical protein